MKTYIQTLFLTVSWLALATINSQLSTAFAQGTTAFTYQGQLRDGGTNAYGAFAMVFKLYDAAAAGNQIGSAVTNIPTLANGLFSVNLDFGAVAFNGRARWLDITVADDTLTPRVPVLLAPYALYAAVAATVTNGAIMNAQLAADAVNATNVAGGQVVKSLNGLKDSVILAAGTNVTLATNGQTLTISTGAANSSLVEGSFNGMRMMAGGVSSSGAINIGSGFTSSHSSTGHFHVDFTSPFSQVPAIIATGAAVTYEVLNQTVSGFNVQVSHLDLYQGPGPENILSLVSVFVDHGFSFVAVGAK